MLALEVDFRDLSDLGVKGGVDGADEAGLADPRLAGEQAYLAADGFPQGVNAFAGDGGCLDHAVAGALVDAPEGFHLVRDLVAVQVHLVEHQRDGHAIDFAGDQQAVQEGQLDLREIE